MVCSWQWDVTPLLPRGACRCFCLIHHPLLLPFPFPGTSIVTGATEEWGSLAALKHLKHCFPPCISELRVASGVSMVEACCLQPPAELFQAVGPYPFR